MDYDTLIGGEYKILLEPIAYYKFEGVMIATTATEAALYDEVVGGQLRYWMGSLTAKNLPLSMFLETPDLGYPAWSGPTNKNVSNSDIKSSLGLGIVRFEEQPEEFDLTIHQCLWHDTCVSCGCPEVCRFFCECDNYAFGDLKKVGFRRTQTLGTGGDCCDFHFYKK